MLPAIDMINHSTEQDKRNTLLRKSSAEVTVKVDGSPLTLQGFFTMKAGQEACRQTRPTRSIRKHLLSVLPSLHGHSSCMLLCISLQI